MWYRAYRAYDDDTLTALGNAGLLRRAAKDVEAGKVAWLEQGDTEGVIGVDGQRVRLDARGPAQMRCDCPAPGICKHILGAVLWLRSLDVESPTAAQSGTAPAVDPLAEVLELSAASLFKAAGIAAVRRAAAMPVADLEWQVQGGALVMTLPGLGQTCRWVAGAGFGGMVSEVPASERKAVHLIALAALRAAQGRPLEWPESARPVVVAPAADNGIAPSERDFLDQVDATLRELVAGGLSHVSELTSARLLALNMSARSEGLPRLAALLRNLGGTVELLVRRDHRADEADALAMLARIHALCTALRQARGELAASLRGRVQREFDEGRPLQLLPLGAHWWQTRGGARGLTVAFWDLEDARVLQSTLARPDGSDVTFTRQSAWAAQALWPGAGTAQRICESSLRLERPRLAPDGRLALGGATRAQPAPMWSSSDPRLESIGCGDWTDLQVRLRAATGLAGEPFDAVLLRPSRTRAPVVDEVGQCLTWSLGDAAGRWLTLQIPAGDEHLTRIENLDRLLAHRTPVHGVLVRIERSAARVELMPLGLLSSGAKGELKVISLDFADEAARSASLATRIRRLFESRRDTAPPTAAATLASRLLAPVMQVLEVQAATGRMPLSQSQAQRLDDALRRLASVGLQTLVALLRTHLAQPCVDSVLRLYYQCQLTMELDGVDVAGSGPA